MKHKHSRDKKNKWELLAANVVVGNTGQINSINCIYLCKNSPRKFRLA